MYLVFSHMLKSFDREDFETLWKLVKAKYGSTKPMEDLDLTLWGDLKTMFEPHVEDRVWKNQQDYRVLYWKLYDSCGVHSLRMQHIHIHMLGRIVGIKSFLMLFGITVALIDVNVAQSKLVLLVNFNENYSKCLRLLEEVTTASGINAAEGVNAANEEVSTAELVSTAYVICSLAQLVKGKPFESFTSRSRVRAWPRPGFAIFPTATSADTWMPRGLTQVVTRGNPT
ncbi:hypothetical protein Tco_1272442 [Tanacetum coccineum]